MIGGSGFWLFFAFATLFAWRLEVLFLILDDSILLLVRLGLLDILYLLALFGLFAIGTVGNAVLLRGLLSILLLRLLGLRLVIIF